MVRPAPPPEAGPDAYARWLEQEHADEFRARKEGRTKPNGAGFRSTVEPLPTIRASSWHGQERPQRHFLDQRHFIPLSSCTILSGAGAVGKTLIMLQLAIACATGGKWLGGTVRAGPAVFYSAEEPMKELQIRSDEICEAENLFLSALGDLHIVDLNDIANPELIATGYDKQGRLVMEPTERLARLEETIRAVKPVVVLVDNRAMVLAGNENDRNVATFMMRQLQLLAERHETCVILMAHPSMTGINQGTGSSGSTGWMNTARSFLYMAKANALASTNMEDPGEPDDPHRRTLTNNKANYSAMGSVINMRWEFNRFICTDPPLDVPREAVGRLSKAERVFMKLLHWHTRMGLPVLAMKNSRQYGPKLFDNHKDREGINLRWFEMAYQSLLEQGLVKVLDRGPKSKPVSYIVPVKEATND